jgi:hypothetical protein
MAANLGAFGCLLVFLASSSEIMAEPIEWRIEDGGNGHFYDRIAGPGSGMLPWKEARDYAASLRYRGVRGHLATVTSEAEWKFLVEAFPNDHVSPSGAWLGGYQDVNASDYKEPDGGWRWVTGEPWRFTAWSPHLPEPNDAFGVGSENYLEFLPSDSAGWNDEGQERRLIVEFPVQKEPSTTAIAGELTSQDAEQDGSIFDALKVGDWVRYSTTTNGSLIDITVVSKPANTTIEEHRKELARQREEANAFRSKSNEIRRELQTANLAAEERAAKEQLLQRLQRDVAGRGGMIAPYEVTKIHKEYVVLGSETQNRFIAKTAVRMIIRNVSVEGAESTE